MKFVILPLRRGEFSLELYDEGLPPPQAQLRIYCKNFKKENLKHTQNKTDFVLNYLLFFD